MNTTTLQTRRESNKKVNKRVREQQVLEILSDGIERTANASPRLTDLLEQRKVIIVCKALDHITGKKVAVFKIAS